MSITSNMIPNIVLLISLLPDVAKKCFCTPVRAMDAIFQMSQPVYCQRNNRNVNCKLFFKHPVWLLFGTALISYPTEIYNILSPEKYNVSLARTTRNFSSSLLYITGLLNSHFEKVGNLDFFLKLKTLFLVKS